MEIAVIENEDNQPHPLLKHNWIQILYMIISTVCFIIEVYYRISIDSSCQLYLFQNREKIFSMNRHFNLYSYSITQSISNRIYCKLYKYFIYLVSSFHLAGKSIVLFCFLRKICLDSMDYLFIHWYLSSYSFK